jgi:hypothetical protein
LQPLTINDDLRMTNYECKPALVISYIFSLMGQL